MKRIKSIEELKNYAKKDEKGFGNLEWWTTSKMLVLKIDEKENLIKKWGINNNNELIYWLPQDKYFMNNYFNLNIWELGTSRIKIYSFTESGEVE